MENQLRIRFFNNVTDGQHDSMIEVEEIIFTNGKARTRIASIYGTSAELQRLIDENEKDGFLPGKIILHEYRESQIPDKYLRKTPWSIKSVNYIKNHLEYSYKRDSNGILVKYNNEHIVRFFEYTSDFNDTDILVNGDFQDVKDTRPAGEMLKSNNTERSLASVKRENAVMIPLVAILVLGVILTLIMVPSLATTVGIIFGALILFFFAGWAYQMFFHGEREFSMLRSLVSGVVVILIIALIIFIMDVTKTPNDPDMWRHP